LRLVYFQTPISSGIGFILYEGGYSGNSTYYERAGIKHRWDRGGPEDNDYAFVMEPDGTGFIATSVMFDLENPSGQMKCIPVGGCSRRVILEKGLSGIHITVLL
jgi:hypothetical protein